MNKRIRNKIAKRKALEAMEQKKEIHSVQPTVPMATAARTDEVANEDAGLRARVANELSSVVKATKSAIGHVVDDVSEQTKQAALEIEKKAEHLLEKVPLVGDAAASVLHKIAEKKIADKVVPEDEEPRPQPSP